MPVRRADVIDAAMELLDESGLDQLSTRRIADRLGVRVGAIYWHVKDKDELLAELADRVVGSCLGRVPVPDGRAEPPADPVSRLTAAAHAVRDTMLAHPDGAALVAGHAVPGPNSLVLADRLCGIAREAGLPLPLAAIAGDTLLSYVTGFVLQEQRRGDPLHHHVDTPVPAPDFDPHRLPHLAAALAEGLPDDDTAFAAGIDLLVTAVTSRARPRRPR
ncbi:TetR/AcrR family transcriptional regulator [Streptomyces sp. TLI_105]|uniref:TetR/AcrR family transcriptional regulator n=1 Tax=Streptomyces sp. TLI_105 TaxID=1881019 RepID=UPI00089AA8DA|nr:TetR/AcrR family transcriptional regulator [Streptomyces sp. TLI_105]SEB64680.1 transcriptional regulator, TetR family [Streptomyces sp. TLI_105]